MEDPVNDFLFQYHNRIGAPHFGDNYTCIQPHLFIKGVTIYVPFQIPVMFLCMCLGIYGFFKIHPLKNFQSSLAYSLMFAFFAGMNFTGIFANSFFPSGWTYGDPGSNYAFWTAMGDTFCTTVVNTFFTICALCDLQLLNDKTPLFRFLVASILLLVAYGYYLCVNGKWNGFNFLYLTTCEIGFVVFTASAVVFLIKNRNVFFRGFAALSYAVVCGILGIKTLYASQWICDHFGNWIGDDLVWFFFSGNGLLGLFMYFLATREARKIKIHEFDKVESQI
eukprot:TRINITY_DN4526_c0_g1_i1.p1 TRINITY_DN4526_c0_g1~~TRINITY_DN4526_c0_g1_i1.p1  ORF type:complete len:279 (-),score=38.12 TRINITY_DN4526_c0_g1_i1:39-875(-)